MSIIRRLKNKIKKYSKKALFGAIKKFKNHLKVNFIGWVKRKIQKNAFLLILNDDCLDQVFRNLSRDDLVNVCRTRNFRMIYAGERTFIRKYVKSASKEQINSANIKNSIATCETFGHLIKKMVITFKQQEIGSLLNFLDKYYVSKNLEELELCHFPEDYPQGLGSEELKSFIGGLNERFPNLKHLKIDYRVWPSYCSYFKYIPALQNLESITIMGMIWIIDIFKFFHLQNALQSGMWQFLVIRKGYLLKKM